MRTVKYYSALWRAYMRVGVLSMVQYPSDSVIWIISMLIREASGFIGIVTLAGIAGGLGNWNLYEICMLFSMCAVIEAIGQAFFDCIWSIDRAVRRGDFDVYLVRPASPFVQMLGQVMHFPAVISMFVYIAVFVWASIHLGIVFDIKKILILIEYIVCGTVINTGIYTIFNCLNFWIVQGEDIAVLVQTCREFVKYPLNIFPKVIQGFFTFVLPLGFVAYYPALYLLGKTTNPIWLWLPVEAALVAFIASVLWRKGLKGYNSTGT